MLSHVGADQNPKMVNVTAKNLTKRIAKAGCTVDLPEEVMQYIDGKEIMSKKGPVLATAIIAGTMAVKKVHDLIPFCHSINVSGCQIDTEINLSSVNIICTVEVEGKTGVEMEALVGANIAALTIYDMCKSLSHKIRVNNVRLLEKKGGKSDI